MLNYKPKHSDLTTLTMKAAWAVTVTGCRLWQPTNSELYRSLADGSHQTHWIEGLLKGHPALRSSFSETFLYDDKRTEQGPFNSVLKDAAVRNSPGKAVEAVKMGLLVQSLKFTILTVHSISVLSFPFCVSSDPFLLPCCNLSPFIAFLLNIHDLY